MSETDRSEFVPGDYEVARAYRYRVIVEREEHSMLLQKTEDGRYVLTPRVQEVRDMRETRQVLLVEVDSVDLAALIAFLKNEAPRHESPGGEPGRQCGAA